MHGYLEAENCQNVDPKLQYGVVTHFNEPGVHKIDLIHKRYEKFINTTTYGCKSTFGLAYSSVTKYAFVQCLGYLKGNKQRKMIVVDLFNDTVIHADDAITDQATGYLYASPDGKYVVVINPDKVCIESAGYLSQLFPCALRLIALLSTVARDITVINLALFRPSHRGTAGSSDTIVVMSEL